MHEQPKGLVLAPVPKQVVFTGAVFYAPKPLVDAVSYYDGTHGPVPGVDVTVGLAAGEDRSEPKFRREGYELSITTDGVTIRAPSQRGAFNAMMTLRQILRQVTGGWVTANGTPGAVPCLDIVDWPDFESRGIMLDVSRDRVPTLETMYRLVDLCAELKINHVELYTEHTYAYSGHEAVWRTASPFTAEEIGALDQYCLTRHIELVPNQNSFGHMERWLRLDRYRHLAECPDGWVDPNGTRIDQPFSLSPAVAETIPFLAGLYDELLPSFTSTQLNVGCDETFDLGQGRSAELCRTKGRGRVYLDFLKDVHDLVTARGRTMLYWGDIILQYPELVHEVPRDAVALVWGYEASHPFADQCRTFAEIDVPFYVCPGTSGWNSIGGRWDNAKANIENAAKNGLAYGAAGMLTTEWGDNGHFQQFPVALPGYVYGASMAWSVQESMNLPVSEVLSRHVFRDATGNLAHALLTLGTATSSLGVSMHNATVLSAVLRSELDLLCANSYAELTGRDFSPCKAAIEAAIEQAGLARPESADADLLVREVDFTGRFMRHACRLADARFSSGVKSVNRLDGITRRTLSDELHSLLQEYRALWNQRSRPGGLEDSTRRIEDLIARYRD